MPSTRHNPNDLEDGMVVRKVSQPSAVFRVSGDPATGRATYVAMTKGQRTILNGNARNYRPETDAEAAERQDGDTDIDTRIGEEHSDVEASPRSHLRAVRSVESPPDPAPATDVAELCRRLEDAVALIEDGTCSPIEAAAIVRAAAELNWAVSRQAFGTGDAPED
ncbi:hypothetical protein [Rhodococcoides kyotonense]|uniref:Uncharacterized protein n=1 Tax=Rhodococcoides kyotonense TaxID=398843 RepID=A0A239H664_9NOCA|nr:hypothetical protein [Rhodococcus kyotonensis]SNS76283.1 hypothetical protein SAMN05421642_10587 [Rhodococcus kyotonensis]